MKARIKATGEIVEVREEYDLQNEMVEVFYSNDEAPYEFYERDELDFNVSDNLESPDYWTRLEHTYASMAMQGMVKRAYNAYCDDCANYENMIFEDAQALLKDHAEALADVCVEFAHALVEKLKEKEE